MKTIGYSIATLIFALDQLVKYWVTNVLHLRDHSSLGEPEPIALLPHFQLTWVENTGVSMGLLRAAGPTGRALLILATLAIAIGVAVWIAREVSRFDAAALGLVLGGALGNIVDRVRFGYVVDFFDAFWGAHHFYVFNVADAAITVGVILLLGRSVFAPPPAVV